MKSIILMAACFIASAASAQRSTHHVSLGISNNGQLSQAMARYYFNWFYAPSTQSYNSSALKGDLSYSFTVGGAWEFGLTAGYGQRKDNLDGYQRAEFVQHYLSAMPFALKNWNFNAVQVSAGAGISCYAMSSFQGKVRDLGGHSAYVNISGGTAFGISGLTRIQWNFTERLSLNGLANFGVLHTDYGQRSSLYNYDPQGNLAGLAQGTNRQQRTIIPSPELSLSLGFKI